MEEEAGAGGELRTNSQQKGQSQSHKLHDGSLERIQLQNVITIQLFDLDKILIKHCIKIIQYITNDVKLLSYFAVFYVPLRYVKIHEDTLRYMNIH